MTKLTPEEEKFNSESYPSEWLGEDYKKRKWRKVV